MTRHARYYPSDQQTLIIAANWADRADPIRWGYVDPGTEKSHVALYQSPYQVNNVGGSINAAFKLIREYSESP